MLHEELTHEIIKAFYEVHKTLGFGFLEQVYQNALYKELCRRGLKVECQKQIRVFYKEDVVGFYVADMIVEDTVILELKAVQSLRLEHEFQLISIILILLNHVYHHNYPLKVLNVHQIKHLLQP